MKFHKAITPKLLGEHPVRSLRHHALLLQASHLSVFWGFFVVFFFAVAAQARPNTGFTYTTAEKHC